MYLYLCFINKNLILFDFFTRKKRIKIAKPTTVSIAAIAMINIAMIFPSVKSEYKYLLKTTKFKLTVFNIISTDIKIPIILASLSRRF